MKELTCGRDTNNASLFDFVLTNNNDFIDNVPVKAVIVSLKLFCKIFLLCLHILICGTIAKQILKRWKHCLTRSLFNTSIKKYADTEINYVLFHSTLNQAKKYFIRKKVLKPNLNNHHVKLNGTATAKLHKEQRVWKNI